MAMKAGNILTVGNQTVIDRIQTGGVSNFNIPQEKIYETGNYQTVATVRDVPDLSFDIETLDVSTEIEALLTGVDPTTTVDGDEFDFATHMPIDVISPFKAGGGLFNIVKGIAIPYLTLEQVTYRFGIRQNATQTYTLRGDSVYYIPGTPYAETQALTSGAGETYNFAETAKPYEEQGDTIYALSVCVKDPSTARYRRLFPTTDYTDTSGGVTLIEDWDAAGYTDIHFVYGSDTAASYPQNMNQGVSVKPAAVRPKDICLYVSDGAATPTLLRWSGVQSFEATRRVTLDNDEEFCNPKYVSSDYDVPDVSGSVGIKAFDADDLFEKIAQIGNLSETDIVGAYSSAPLEVECVIKHPDTGDTVKTIYIPDARFTLPAIQPRANTKVETTFNWQSDTGTILIYKGDRP